MLMSKKNLFRQSNFNAAANWHAIRHCRLLNHACTGHTMVRPHRKASITVDLGSLGFLLIILLIAGFAELIGRVWKPRVSRVDCAREDANCIIKNKN